jgi:hypothetical protein
VYKVELQRRHQPQQPVLGNTTTSVRNGEQGVIIPSAGEKDDQDGGGGLQEIASGAGSRSTATSSSPLAAAFVAVLQACAPVGRGGRGPEEEEEQVFVVKIFSELAKIRQAPEHRGVVDEVKNHLMVMIAVFSCVGRMLSFMVTLRTFLCPTLTLRSNPNPGSNIKHSSYLLPS